MFLVVKYNYSQSNLIFQHARGFLRKPRACFYKITPPAEGRRGWTHVSEYLSKC